MTIRHIPPDAWWDELDSFSRQHEGWIVSVSTKRPDGHIDVESHDLPLQGVSRASPQSSDIAIAVGDRGTHITHQVRDPMTLTVELNADEAERALLIDGRDGSTTSVEFRSPMLPEEVDGLPTPEDRGSG